MYLMEGVMGLRAPLQGSNDEAISNCMTVLKEQAKQPRKWGHGTEMQSDSSETVYHVLPDLFPCHTSAR